MANQNAIQDSNQVWTLLVASGTQDTSSGTPPDTLIITGSTIGTFQGMHVVPLGTMDVNLVGTTVPIGGGGSNVNIFSGTQQTLGTVGTLVGVGTITNIGSIGNIGNLPTITLDNYGSNVNVVTGSQQTLGTVGSVLGIGSISNLGSITNIGTLPTVTLDNYGSNVNVVSGSSVGTLLGGTLQNLATGTINALASGTITNGTFVMPSGTLTTGSITDITRLYGGTIQAGTFVQPSGTITTIAAGTQNTLGTVGSVLGIGGTTTVRTNPIPVGSAILSTHTLGTGGGTVVGTLLAPTGAGTTLYLAGLSLIVRSGTVDCGIANNVAGTTGAGVYARGNFVPSAGIVRDYSVAKNLGTNGTITYFIVSAGTVDFQVDYWVTP